MSRASAVVQAESPISGVMPDHTRMRRPTRLLGRLAALCSAVALVVQPVAAQSVLRDAETEALFDDMARPLIAAAGLDPNNVDIVLINDNSVNAFVAGGQAVYLNSGLINTASTANEVQGVIAHELGHVTGGHAINDRGAGKATGISLLSLLAGVGAALLGAGDAAMGVIMAGQQAALGSVMAFSRGQESAADAAGAKYLSQAGITGKGSIEFFKKLQNMEFRYGYSPKPEDAFYGSHPMTGDRIETLEDTYKQDPAWNRPPDPSIEARFQRAKAKLSGYLVEPSRTLIAFPETMTSVPARYARAYAWHKEARLEKALGEVDALLADAPDDPYFLELKGQILLEAGKPREALASLRRATELTNNQPLIATLFGHALMATEERANFIEAERVLKAAVARDRENPFAWHQLGMVYAANGDLPRARLASAEQQSMSNRMTEALHNAEAAVTELPRGSSDWLRAQDIAMHARAAIERDRKRR